MMFKQSIYNIKVVIIPLDGTILDLNRYRYNYYRHLCEKRNIELSKEEFYQHLSSMYDMYNGLPLSEQFDTGILNAKIERELSQYLQFKGFKVKEGFLELIEYLHQKNIQVAIMSTHRTKDAINYLKMTKIYNKVQYIIGSDAQSLPLPSTQILENIQNYFQISPQETLVISSFMSLNQAAINLHMNVIYCEDLVEAGEKEKATSYKVVKNLFEVMNAFLFDRYNEAELYSPILGMNSKMSKDELDKKKQKLEEAYEGDQQLIDLIDRTYTYHVSQLTDPIIKDASVFQPKITPRKRFTFDDEDISFEDTAKNLLDPQESPLHVQKKESTQEHISALRSEDEKELTLLLDQIIKKENQKESTSMKESKTQDKNISIEEEDSVEMEEEKNPLLFSCLVEFVYILASSFLILFIGIIIYIALIHQFSSHQGIFTIISKFFEGYYGIIRLCIQTILDAIHQWIPFVPSYEQYETMNVLFSMEGVQLFNIYIFQTVIITITKIIIYFTQKNIHKNEGLQ